MNTSTKPAVRTELSEDQVQEIARLGKGRGIEDQHTLKVAQFLPDLSRQFQAQSPIIPLRHADEL